MKVISKYFEIYYEIFRTLSKYVTKYFEPFQNILELGNQAGLVDL